MIPPRALARLGHPPLRFHPLTILPTVICLCLIANTALARSGGSLDHRVKKDTGGIYAAQNAVPITLGLLVGACALWGGTEDRFSRTCWEAGEGSISSYVLAKGIQVVTKRESPSQTDDPGRWSAHINSGSFPSGHVAFTTALVTPFVMENFEAHPWLSSALLLLPAYEMVARVKSRDHWQTDVLGGALLGFAVGAYEFHRDSPFVFTLLPGGAMVGFHHSF